MSSLPPISVREDGVVVVRASSFGGCEASLAALLMGHPPEPPPESMRKRFGAGQAFEPAIVEELRAQGWNVTGRQDEVCLEALPGKMLIIGHVDGRASRLGLTDDRVLECKSSSPDEFKKLCKLLDAKGGAGLLEYHLPHYAWQLSLYMHATGLSALYAVGNRDATSGIEVETFPIDEPPISLPLIKARALRILIAERQGEMGKCNVKMFPCPVYYLHDDDEHELDFLPADSLLATFGRTYDSWRRKKQAAEKAMADLRDKILPVMDGRDKVIAGNVSIALTPTTSKRLDKDRLGKACAEAGIALEDYEDMTTSTRLDVKVRDDS